VVPAIYALDYFKTGKTSVIIQPEEPSRGVLLACLKSGLFLLKSTRMTEHVTLIAAG